MAPGAPPLCCIVISYFLWLSLMIDLCTSPPQPPQQPGVCSPPPGGLAVWFWLGGTRATTRPASLSRTLKVCVIELFCSNPLGIVLKCQPRVPLHRQEANRLDTQIMLSNNI